MLKNKISTLVIEKDEFRIKSIATLLKNFSEIDVVGHTTDCRQAITFVYNLVPQLIILGLELEEMHGFEFVNTLHNRHIFPEIIFLSESSKPAYDALAYEPLDFWVMPVQKEVVQEMIERFKTKLKKKELYSKLENYANSGEMDSRRVFPQKKGILVLNPEEIVFCRANLMNSIIILKNGDSELLKSSLTETIEIINSEDFIRVNRSNCINQKYLRKFDRKNNKCILYNDGKTWNIPVSKGVADRLDQLNTNAIY